MLGFSYGLWNSLPKLQGGVATGLHGPSAVLVLPLLCAPPCAHLLACQLRVTHSALFSPLLFAQVLSCLVQIASVRRSLFNNAERAKFLSHLVDGVKRILENPQVSLSGLQGQSGHRSSGADMLWACGIQQNAGNGEAP